MNSLCFARESERKNAGCSAKPQVALAGRRAKRESALLSYSDCEDRHSLFARLPAPVLLARATRAPPPLPPNIVLAQSFVRETSRSLRRNKISMVLIARN